MKKCFSHFFFSLPSMLTIKLFVWLIRSCINTHLLCHSKKKFISPYGFKLFVYLIFTLSDPMTKPKILIPQPVLDTLYFFSLNWCKPLFRGNIFIIFKIRFFSFLWMKCVSTYKMLRSLSFHICADFHDFTLP